MTGYTRAEIIGQSLRLPQGSRTDHAEPKRISIALRQMGSVRAGCINYTKSGSAWSR